MLAPATSKTLDAISGERPKSGKKVILATQRALEQQALERWRMQQEAQIDQMVRDGLPLGAVAAALASPETAERIALIDAAWLSLRRARQDSAVLDGLLAPPRATASTVEVADELLTPLGLGRLGSP